MDQLRRWNRWYDELPELLRFPVVLGLLVLVGAINLALTISTRFPFGLLVLLAILVLAAIRLPYLIGASNPARSDWGEPAPAPPAPAPAGWAGGFNRWYESFPELWRFQLIVWALVVVGALNMALTIGGRFPFGFLVLLAVIVIAAIRVPHVMGWGHAASAANTGTASTAVTWPEKLSPVVPPQEAHPEPPPERPLSHPADTAHEPEVLPRENPPNATPESVPPRAPPDAAVLFPEVEGPTSPPEGPQRPA